MSYQKNHTPPPPKWEDWMFRETVPKLNRYLIKNNFEKSEKVEIKKYIRKLKNRDYSKKYRNKQLKRINLTVNNYDQLKTENLILKEILKKKHNMTDKEIDAAISINSLK